MVGHPPLSSFTVQAARPRWPTFHLRYLRPQKAPRDVRHAKLHCFERLRRMVALQGRNLEDPSLHVHFSMRYETGSLYGASSRGIAVKKKSSTSTLQDTRSRSSTSHRSSGASTRARGAQDDIVGPMYRINWHSSHVD